MRAKLIVAACIASVLVHAGCAVMFTGCLQKQPHQRTIDYRHAPVSPPPRGDYRPPDSKRSDHYRYPVYPLPYYGEREA
jgi:hypothetical protein